MRTSMHVDYLSITNRTLFTERETVLNSRDAGELCAWVTALLRIPTMFFEPVKPKAFYPYCWKIEPHDIEIRIPFEPKKQGVQVVLAGASFTSLPDPTEFLRHALEKDWNVTRIDFAVNVFDPVVDVELEFDRWRDAHPETRRSVSLKTSSTGATFYLGSRQSEKMLRVYDKGRQQRVDFNWIRCEMEYKGAAATNAAHSLVVDTQTVLSDMHAYYDMTDGTLATALSELVTDPTKRIKVQPRKEPQREFWFYEQVYPALRAWLEEDPVRAEKWIEEAFALLR